MPQDGAQCKVEILEKEGIVKDKWGNDNLRVKARVDGVELIWDMSPTAQKSVKESGVNGNTFYIKRWDANGKTGFNYVPEGDVSLNYPPTEKVPQVKEPIVDDYAEKVSRGAAWNNAVSWVCATYKDNSISTLAEFLDNVKSVAEEIAIHQKAFVNGEKKVEEVPLPEPPPEINPEDDLPF